MNEGIGVLIAFLVAFVLAQMIKTVIAVAKAGGVNFKKLVSLVMASGGMPSGHAASLMAATMYLGLAQGMSTGFAIMCCMTAIVCYDAVNVRYAVGEQGKMLKNLMHRKMRIVEGHTVPQMLAGLVLGVLVGVLVFVVSKFATGGF